MTGVAVVPEAGAGSHVLTLDELDANPWASCGPAALTALLGRPLAEIRHAFPNQREGRTWTNLRQMRDALTALRVPWSETDAAGEVAGVTGAEDARWPTRGLVIVQFRGSWDVMPVHHPAQLQRSHWIAVKPHPTLAGVPIIFDINSIDEFPPMSLGWWDPIEVWSSMIAPQLAQSFGKKATGAWWARAGIEVR